MIANIRNIRYIHQGPDNGIGWQVYINDLNDKPFILKEFIMKIKHLHS